MNGITYSNYEISDHCLYDIKTYVTAPILTEVVLRPSDYESLKLLLLGEDWGTKPKDRLSRMVTLLKVGS